MASPLMLQRMRWLRLALINEEISCITQTGYQPAFLRRAIGVALIFKTVAVISKSHSFSVKAKKRSPKPGWVNVTISYVVQTRSLMKKLNFHFFSLSNVRMIWHAGIAVQVLWQWGFSQWHIFLTIWKKYGGYVVVMFRCPSPSPWLVQQLSLHQKQRSRHNILSHAV